MTPVRVAFTTLGCRLNQVDTQEIQGALEARGFRTVPSEEGADVVVVNSCTVTARAEVSDRQAVRRAARQNPGARIVVTGCWAQTNPAAAGTGADLVVGNADKHRLAELLDALLRDGRPREGTRVVVSDVAAAQTLPPAPRAGATGRVRAFLKVQEGCRHRCAFCIVPFARGASRSRPPGVVVDEVVALVEEGHPEVVLTGVDLGDYGADLVPRTTLADLVRRLVEVPGLSWLRMSSLLPAYFTEALVEAVNAPVVAPHLHIPLQSGSDRVLRRMRRPYSLALYERLVDRLVAAIPRLGLGTDLIAGFPGETEADFAETVAAVDRLPFSYLHVFAYSDRKGTAAERLDGHLAARIVTERSRGLRELGHRKSRAFRERLLGRVEAVLVLETADGPTGRLVGLTGNYVEVIFAGPERLRGQLVNVRVTAVDGPRTLGEVA